MRLQKIGIIQTAVDHLDFGPIFASGPAVELASTKFANRDHELGPMNFRSEPQDGCLVKFLGAVDGEAIGGATQDMGEHRDRGRVRPEVGMQVGDP